MFSVYKITNLKNGRYYIGVQKDNKKDVENYYGSGTLIKEAIRVYSIENFKKEILFTFNNSEDAYIKENELVDLNDPLCYNLKEGGKGGWDHIDNSGENNCMKNNEIKEKQNELRKETIYKNKEYYDNISKENLIKAIEANTGRKRDEETKEKISLKLNEFYKNNESKLKGVCKTEEERRKMSEGWTQEKRRRKSEQQKDRIKEQNIDMGKYKRGKKTSEETKEKLSEEKIKYWEQKRKNGEYIVCPFCNKKSINKGNMTRFHFDNCRYKNE